MADSYVCSGATMKCSMGTSQAKLTVLPTRTVLLTGQPMANISDHLSMVNLAPFGRCRSMGFPATASATAAAQGTLTPMPCMHNTPFPWMGGKNDYIIKGDPALLKSSTCQCMWGGTISLVTDGQTDTGQADMSRIPKEDFHLGQKTQSNVKSGTLSDKYNKALELKAKGFSLIDSIKIANQSINLRNSRNEEGFMSDEEADLQHSNRHYGENRQYGINCATTTTTFMLRKQGYDVTARARNANNHTNSIAYGLNIYKAWKNRDGTDVTPTMLREVFNAKVNERNLEENLAILENTKAELVDIKENKIQLNKVKTILNSPQFNDRQIRKELGDIGLNETTIQNVINNPGLCDSAINSLSNRESVVRPIYDQSRELFAPIYKEVLIDSCQEEGYYTFGLVWEQVDYGGGHYTVIKSEKDENGNIVLSNIEPQNGDPIEDIDTLIDLLDYPPDSDDTIMRTDNKVFNEDYSDLFDI